VLLERYGFRRAAGNRFGRIVVPFVVGWLVVFPLSMLLAGTGLYNFDIAWEFIVSGASWPTPIRCICGFSNT